MNTFTLVWVVVICVIVAVLVARYKYRSYNAKRQQQESVYDEVPSTAIAPEVATKSSPVVLHRLCPHSKVIQGVELQQKDSLDEHLDMLTRKLAEKEGRLQLSRTKIRETQFEIDNLHALDSDVRAKYKDIMDSLRSDLTGNEKECMKLQEQIEWVSRKRAEIGEEVTSIEACNLQIEEVQQVMTQLEAVDHEVHDKYNDLIVQMREELLNSELQCKELQDQIYWVTRRRVEIGEEINRTSNLYEKGKLELKNLNNLMNLRGSLPLSKSTSSTYSNTHRLY